MREIIYNGRLPELLTLFESVGDKELLKNEEVEMAWQEYLCLELDRATKKKDQAALKEALTLAGAHGMQHVEKPMHKALEVFVDPPEMVVDLHGTEAHPDA